MCVRAHVRLRWCGEKRTQLWETLDIQETGEYELSSWVSHIIGSQDIKTQQCFCCITAVPQLLAQLSALLGAVHFLGEKGWRVSVSFKGMGLLVTEHVAALFNTTWETSTLIAGFPKESPNCVCNPGSCSPGMAVEQRLCVRSPVPTDQGKGLPRVFSWLPVWNHTCCQLASHLPRVTSSLFLQCRWSSSWNSWLEFPAFPCFMPRCFLLLPYKTPNSPPSPFNYVIKCNEIEVNLRQSNQDACT